MFYLWLFLSMILLTVLKELVQQYVWFKESHPHYSYIKNILWHRRFDIKIEEDTELFIRTLLSTYSISCENSKYYIGDDNITFNLELNKRSLILQHVQFNANVINTTFITFETMKVIKDEQKKLTRASKYC